MYGARGARPVEAREGISLPQYSMMPRKPVYSGGNDNNSRASRGKAIVDEDTRLGSSRGGHHRALNFPGATGKSRGIVEHADRHRADNLSRYGTVRERRVFRDDGTMWKVVPGADKAPLRAEGGGRLRDGLNSRGERVIEPAVYSDDAKLVRNGNYEALSYDDGAGSLYEMEYLPVTKSVPTTRATLPGFVFECPKRSILEFFSSPKGSFVLPLDDPRFAEQVGPTTKIFMFDRMARELHGVFQAESYSRRVSQGPPVRLRVRVAKECLPLTERQFKEILHENYYTHSDFTENLTKEQVMKLLQTFRSLDSARGVHVSFPTSRRISDSGLSHSSQEFHSISDEIVYRKEERWRRGTVNARSLSGHSYHSQEATHFSSKLPAQSLPVKSLDELEDYGDDEGIKDFPVSASRLTITGSSPYSTSRGKQQSLRSLSGSRTSIGHLVGHASQELKLAEGNWREDIDQRDFFHRKRQALSPSPVDELKRGGLSASPPWKDAHPMVDESIDEIYDRQGKGVHKEETSYLSSRRWRHNDIDLNISSGTGHAGPAQLHDTKSKGVRRMVWDDHEEDERGYSVSPPKGSLLRGSSSLQIPDHLLSSEAVDDYDDDSRLDSRLMVSASRKEYPLLRAEEKGRPVSDSFSNGTFGNSQSRTVTMKNYSNDKPVPNPIIRNRPVSSSKEPTLRGVKSPVFQIKANLQTPKRGRPERVVTMVNKDNFRSGGNEGYGNGGCSSQGRKRKASVWSRITLPGKGPGQKGSGPQGKGRVFSRLGPSASSSFERKDDTYGYKSKKPRVQQTDIESEVESEGFDEDMENSPDALEGEDYLNDDHDVEESDKKLEKIGDDLQGWTRKKASVVNSGDESGIPDHGTCANAKGGRRKLVRPSIGATTLTRDHAQDTHAQQRSRSGSMDMDMANTEAHEAGNNSPRGSRRDLNSVAEDCHPHLEEDNMMSS